MAVYILMSVYSGRSQSQNERRSKRKSKRNKRTRKIMLKCTKHRGISEAIRTSLRAVMGLSYNMTPRQRS